MYQTALSQLGSTRARTLKTLDALSQAQLNYRPASGKWSAGEILHHLILFDRFFLDNCRKLIALERSGRPAHIRYNFTEVDVAPGFIPKSILPLMVIPFNIASQVTPRCVRDTLIRSRIFRVQHPQFATPTPGLSKSALNAQLNATLLEFAELYDRNQELNFSLMDISHPMLGTNNMIQLLQFADNHEQRHQSQLRDTVRAHEGYAAQC